MVKRPQIGYFLTVDVAVTIIVLSCVVAALALAVTRGRKLVEVSVAAVEVLGSYRTPLSVQYALQGRWPAGPDDLRDSAPRDGIWTGSERLKRLVVDQGGLTVPLRGPLAGERMTLHPAVPSDDPLGPVCWSAGPSGARGWTVAGPDHTTVRKEFLPALLAHE